MPGNGYDGPTGLTVMFTDYGYDWYHICFESYNMMATLLQLKISKCATYPLANMLPYRKIMGILMDEIRGHLNLSSIWVIDSSYDSFL